MLLAQPVSLGTANTRPRTRRPFLDTEPRAEGHELLNPFSHRQVRPFEAKPLTPDSGRTARSNAETVKVAAKIPQTPPPNVIQRPSRNVIHDRRAGSNLPVATHHRPP
jgi:hypothetical protein